MLTSVCTYHHVQHFHPPGSPGNSGLCCVYTEHGKKPPSTVYSHHQSLCGFLSSTIATLGLTRWLFYLSHAFEYEAAGFLF